MTVNVFTQAFVRDPLRERVEDGARERFEAVGEGVHSDRRGEVGGKPHGELGVEDHAARLRDKLPCFDHELVDEYKRSGRP